MKKIIYFFLVFLIITGFKQKSDINSIRKDENGKTAFDYVNPFIGTGDYGHTYPGAVMPFGMVQLSPDTRIAYYKKSYKWCAGYYYPDSTILGFSHTHFSGTGHSDLGDVLIMPVTGKLHEKNDSSSYCSRYSHNEEKASPGYYSVLLKDYDVKAELTVSERAGFHRYTFNKADSVHILLDLLHCIYNYDGKVIWSQIRVENDTLVTGFRQTRGWAKTRYIYFAIAFSKPFKSYMISKDDEITYGRIIPPRVFYNTPEISGQKLKAFFNFKVEKGEQICLKVGISAVSTAGALNNLKTEIPDWDFDKVKTEAEQAWKKELNSIIIEGTDAEKQIFYTSMYHTMLAPMLYMDADRKYRGLDQNIYEAKDFTNYTVFSLWDTYRALHPLFAIIKPERVCDMIKSMLAHYEQNAYKMLPIWSFHANETWGMNAYHAVSVIADAYLKGLRDYDVEKVYEAMITTATRGDYAGLKYYMDIGYVPIDKEPQATSKTLEYAYDDWCIAQMAKGMGKENDYKEFIKRAGYYKNIFDPETNFIRAKKTDGTWNTPFDPILSRSDYTEGNAWQYAWCVPYDVQGLITLMGGDAKFVEKLDSLFIIKATNEKYMSGLIGQYEQGNEPCQHIAYLYNWVCMPWKTQEKIHQIMNNFYNNTPAGICGNDDCGQMSAWYIFSSMGFYPVCPGSNTYVIGSPEIKKATIYLSNGREFVVTANNFSKENIYIQSVTLNGKELKTSWFEHKDIMNGGSLTFNMGPKPNKNWASQKDEIPVSMSKN